MKESPFSEQNAARAVAMLRAMGNPHRMQVLCLLIGHGEMSVSAMLEHTTASQSALSQHLAKMREEGMVTFRREAQTLYYRISNPDVEKLMATLKDIFCT